jgi:hypothetical protein
VSEQQAEQTSGESGSVGAAPDLFNSLSPSPDVTREAAAVSAPKPISVESPALVPAQGGVDETSKVEASKADAPKLEAPKVEAPKVEASKVEVPKVEAPKVEALKIDAPKADAPRAPGRLIMLSGDHSWDRNDAAPEPESKPGSAMFGKRRIAALAAVVALAAATGALGGALATAGFGHLSGDDSRVANSRALEEQVARLDADMAALKAGVEHTSKLGMSQFNKTSDRLDKVEKAQIEPAVRLARLSEAVDKLRAAPVAATPVAAAPVAAKEVVKEVTGSISPPATAPKAEVARLPAVEGWILRDVANGSALIEGRRGMFEVYAGDPVPGLGRVDAIRRQDGRWVVVTSKGLIVAR